LERADLIVTALASLYDVTLEPLRAWDFSRPLFVQASPSAQFAELVDVFHHRLELPPERSTLFTNAAHVPRLGWAGRHLVNPAPRLSAATAAYISALIPEPFSVVVTTTLAHHLAMRFHSNVACFCHAVEPTPCLVINRVGQFAAARDFFFIADYLVGSVRFVANILGGSNEVEALFEAALHRPPGHIVEIGRFSGGMTVLLALAARQSGRPGVVSVDILRLPAVDYFCRVNGVEGDVQLFDEGSEAVAARWRNLQIEPGISLLFIDADHSSDAVSRDIVSWAPYVVRGGTIALHDASTPDCGVAKAIYHHLMARAGFTNFRQVGTTVLCERTLQP
jgi:predicted O-methyltransferase YrrM